MEESNGNFAPDNEEVFANVQAESAGEVLAEVSETHFAAAPICLVLTEDVHKIFAKGDPLIVGTTMGDIQTFFQKVIAEAQLGIEQNAPRAFSRDLGRPSVSIGRLGHTIDPSPSRSTKEKTTHESETEEDMERCEIPLDAIRVYLSEKKYFPGWSANSKRNLRKRCDDFVLENGVLFYITKKNKKVHCVEDRAERMRLIWQQHSIDHRRRDRLFSALKEKYYWKGMLQDVNRVLESCEFCARIRDEKTIREPDEMESAKKLQRKRQTKFSEKSNSKKSKQDPMSPETSNTEGVVAEEEPSCIVKQLLLS